MKWFCELRRWIRVYICFLLPAMIAGILFYCRQWIAAAVFVGIMVFILLPIFIYSEEYLGDRKHSEIINKLIALKPPSPKQIPPQKTHTETTRTQISPQCISGNEIAARDRAAILIATKNPEKIKKRIAELDARIADGISSDEIKKIAAAECTVLSEYLNNGGTP